MNQITQSANPTPNFGYDFDYAVWTANTKVDLVNVPFNNDARDVLAPSVDIGTYIDRLSPLGVVIENMSYVKPNHPVRINLPFNQANRYNYLRATNPAQPIVGDFPKVFYYFILNANYVAPNTTELTLQLDVWHTYINEVKFGNCYVERGHVGIANENQMQNYGRDYLTTPEGLDTGTDYLIAWDEVEKISDSGHSNLRPSVLVCSTVDLKADPGTVDNPILTTASGSSLFNVPSGASYYVFKTGDDFTNFMAHMKNYPWITQGIISATIIPPYSRYNDNVSWTIENGYSYILVNQGVGSKWPIYRSMYPDWRNKSDISNGWPVKYRKLKKFFTYPYMVIELTAWMGTPILLKPELWRNPDAKVAEMESLALPNQKVVIYPVGYNANTDAFQDVTYDHGEYLDYATMISSFPQVPVVNNMAISYLAMNKNSIAYQHMTADWSQQRALGSNQAQYDVATGAISTNRALTTIGINADAANTANVNRVQSRQSAVNLVGDTVTGAIGGSLIPGGGALVGAGAGVSSGLSNVINTGIQIAGNNEAFAIRNTAAVQRYSAESGQSMLSRDTNKSLADWAARGDYANAISGINAKIQDSKMLQPTTSGQVGGDAFNVSWNIVQYFLRWKTIDRNAMTSIGDYWLRYGYAIHRFMKLPESLMVMSKFTYWKLSETYISSATIPEGFKQVIRGYLEKGVTVWSNPDDIGMIDLGDNEALSGVSY